ncbi:MAG: arylesterase [Pseudomonadota bacterium]
MIKTLDRTLAQSLARSLAMAALCGVAACSAEAPADPGAVAPVPAPPATAAAPSADTTPAGPTVVFLGDSLTAGFQLPPGDALPAQVGRVLAARGIKINAVNAGVSGDTTANGLARYDWSVAAANPDLLVIALGANDYLLDLSPDLTRTHLASLIDRAQAVGVPVILAGIEPRSGAAPGSRDAAFASIYPDLAAEYDLPLLPALLEGVRGEPSLLLSDGLHPTAEGVAIMAQQLGEVITPALETLPQ